ncbi:MAG TPA: hypothetical protein GX530_04335 [Corynebacteriales bacterium]|nr:hypothetical protein [Mycobacteriales bacterium]
MENALAAVPEGSTREETISFLKAQIAQFNNPNRGVQRSHLPGVTAVGAWQEIIGTEGLPRHKVTQLDGSMQGLMGCIAGISAADQTIALVGFPDASWSAAYELGAKLDNLVWVPHPGPDSLGIAMVLAAGFDLVVVDCADTFLTPQKVQRYESKIREADGTLLVMHTSWPQAALHISTELIAGEGMQHGYGRLSTLTFRVDIHKKQSPPRTLQWTIGRPSYDVALPVQTVQSVPSRPKQVVLSHAI